MTDKQRKDGIDVSQCECYTIKDNSCSDTLSGSCMKEKCQTFRLLQTIKDKEQECEGLKGRLKYIRDENKYLKESATDEQINFVALNNHIKALEFQIDQLKAKCEELKNNFNIEHAELLNARSEIEGLKKQVESDKGLITNAGKQNYQLVQEYDKLKAENNKYQLFIEKLCEYAGLECDSEEQAIKTLLDLASQMYKAKVINDQLKVSKEQAEQKLEKISRIANGMYDMWINKTKYTDVHNLAEHLLKCELNRIINEFDEIDEEE